MKKKTILLSAASVLLLSFAAFGSSTGFFGGVLTSIRESSIARSLYAGGEKENTGTKALNHRNGDQANVPAPEVAGLEEVPVPDEVVYFILFNHLVGLKAEASRLEGEGETMNYLEMYESQANIDSVQSLYLFQTADDCIRDTKTIDTQARQIINQLRAGTPGGVLLSPDKLPAPPPELKELQSQKEAVVLHYRDVLKNFYGEPKFAEFNTFARTKIVPNVEMNVKGLAPQNTGQEGK